jgi:two-component system response regulator DegU
MKLLLVEDNASVRRILRSVVEPLAEEIHECEDGASAFLLYNAEQPDYVLMDINLKNTDGITTARWIINSDPKAKIIIVTNYDEGDLREAAQKAGVVGYVLKENLLMLRQLLQMPRN